MKKIIRLKSIRELFSGTAAILTLAIILAACSTPAPSNNDSGGGGNKATAVAFQSAVQTGGTSGTADSTALTLTFDVNPATLTADNITVTGTTKGALTGTGTTRSLAISGITAANGAMVSVAITSPAGYSITGSPQTAVVYKTSISAIVPADGSTNVNFPFQITFISDLGTDKGTVTFNYDGTNSITYQDGINCNITISGKIVTIGWWSLESLITYSNIVISGFKDVIGNPIPAYNNPNYKFTTATCFVSGTLVSTTGGMKEIEKITTGDTVYVYDFDSHTVSESRVVKVFASSTSEIYRIGVGKEIIGVTAGHPFYVKDRGWVMVKDLSIGDSLMTSDNTGVVIDSIKRENVSLPVYNIEVDGAHNFFVTATKILVHNK